MKPTYLSLFSGIGGLDLGLDRAGFTCVGQVEKDEYCRRVLAKHWPEVPRHDDVRTAVDWWLGRGGAAVDLVAGGPPCQPFSTKGKRGGVGDARWGWPWMRDVVAAVRPRYVLVENVAALLRDAEAMSIILGDLSDLGFDAEWELVSACAFGAPHTRERLFLVAHPPAGDGEQQVYLPTPVEGGRPGPGAASRAAGTDGWLPEPDVGRVAHGLPKHVVAPGLWALGNAVVPQVAEHIGRLIADHMAASLAMAALTPDDPALPDDEGGA